MLTQLKVKVKQVLVEFGDFIYRNLICSHEFQCVNPGGKGLVNLMVCKHCGDSFLEFNQEMSRQ